MNVFKKIFLSITIMFGLFSIVGCSNEEKSNLDGLLILQVYGVGDEGGTNSPALSNSFIELYNTNDKELVLDGSSIQYSKSGSNWEMLELTGKVPAKSSFLIVANEYSTFTREEINNSDMNWNIVIENKGIKVCLMDNVTKLSVTNPYSEEVSGYVDMVCATGFGETIDAAETNFVVGQSKQKSVRRLNLNDTNNNSKDFGLVDYESIPDSQLDIFLPNNSSKGSHNPFEGIEQVESNNEIVILQIYGTSDNTDTPINRSFIELYNTSSNDISLSGYSIQYITENDVLSKLNLEGTIKAYSSFLIAGKITSVGETVNITIADDDADMLCDWEIDNKKLSIVLLKTTQSLQNFDAFTQFKNGELDSYVDMIGVATNYYETSPATDLSKQKSLRRVSLNDTNNNSADFSIVDYRLDAGLTIEQLKNLAPKCSLDGSWDPFN